MESQSAVFAKQMRDYALRWKRNAARFREDHAYAWMASIIPSEQKVLEIGTGDGSGTLALLKRGHQVLSLDLNPWCLEAASRNLRLHGFDVQYPARRQELQSDPEGHDLHCGPLPQFNLESGAVLLLSDFLADDELAKVLEDIGPFDVICWWCPGAYGHRAGPAHEDRQRYRRLLRSAICCRAERLLCDKGLLHFIDRAADNMSLQKHEKLLRSRYMDLARGTSLTVTHIGFRPIAELHVPGGVPMSGQHAPHAAAGRFRFLSVLLTKTSIAVSGSGPGVPRAIPSAASTTLK